MTSTLHDRLTRLAERAEPDPGPSGSDLWDRGTRYRRQVRAGTAAITASTVLGLAVLTGVSIDRSGPTPEPAPADAPAGLPSRIWTPSPWLPGTDEVGPPGQVVALFDAERGSWTGTDYEPVVVSATTGDYRFLDLPGLATPDDDVALSPDGKKVAYWATGPTSDTPRTSEGDPPASAVAVYDLITGEVERHLFDTEHGLAPDELAWLDGGSLVVAHHQWVGGDDDSAMDRSSGDDPTTWRWDLAQPEPVRWTDAEDARASNWDGSADGRSLVDTPRAIRVVEDAAIGRGLVRPAWLTYDAGRALSPDGTRVAGVWGNARWPNDLAVVPVDTDRREPTAAWRLTGASRTQRVHGWIGDDHVAVTRIVEERPRQGYRRAAMVAVDATSGASTELVELPDAFSYGTRWATDLLDAPVVDRPEPPRPLDPRLVTTGWVLLASIGVLSLWGWRRRVQP